MKNRTLIGVYSFLAVLFGTAILFSCNPYKQIAKRNPVTHTDSTNLAKVCTEVFPLDTTFKFITDTVVLEVDSSLYYKNISDSLKKIGQTVRDSIVFEYRDTCKSAPVIYDKAYALGYKNGFAAGKSDCPKSYTIIITKTVTIKDNREIQIAKAAQAAAEKRTVRDSKTISIWKGIGITLMVILVLGGLGLYFFIRSKFKTK